jgi:hypothetical protein
VAAVRPALTVLAGIVVLALSGCGGSGDAQPAAQAHAQRPLRDLTSVDALKADFNADAGRPRLLLIFSPT